MKKIAFLACILLLTSCGGGNKNTAEDSSPFVDDIPEEGDVRETFTYITKDSIGGIWIGQSVNEVSDSIPGLYTHVTHGASPDAVTITFCGPEGERFIAYDFGEGKIDVLNLINSMVKVRNGERSFGIGDSFSNILSLPGVETEWSEYENSGTWYWKWDSLWFAPSQESVTAGLSRKLYHSDTCPEAEDFDESVKIGFIGTGLPF